MRRRACFNAERCPSIRQAVFHDKRLALSDKRPSYLLADEYHLGNVEIPGSLSLDECLAVEARKRELSSAKARATKGYSPIDEGIIVLADLPEHPIGEALARYKSDQQARLQEWRSRFEGMTGQRVLRIDIHLDEGYRDEGGTPHYNGHAHVLIDRTDDRGRVIRFTRKDDPQYRTITEVNAELQSMTSEVLGLVRGERGSRRRRLSHHQYREAMQRAALVNQDAMDRVSAERDRARESERAARTAEAATKSEAKELYSLLRDLMKASGVAKLEDYSDVRQIKTDVTKLVDAIKYWREKAGDRPSPQTNTTSGSEAGESHGSTERPSRKRHDAAPLQILLPGAVALAGRTSREREDAVRSLQKRLLDRDRTGPILSLSRVVRESVDRGSQDGNYSVRRSAPGAGDTGNGGSREIARRSTDSSAPNTDDSRDTHAIYLDLYHTMKTVGRIAARLPAAVSLRAKAEQYPEAKQHDKANDRQWLIRQLSEWEKRLQDAERLDSEAAEELRTRASAAETAVEHEKEEREADRTAHRRRRHYRPGFGGQGLDRRDRFPFVELDREWDQRARCTAYKAADGETWFVTTRNWVEVINQTEQSMAVALRVAAKKFHGRIEITGPREFRERAARLAARLGIEVVDADLQSVVQAAQSAMDHESSQDRLGPPIEPEAGREEDPDDEPPRGHGR